MSNIENVNDPWDCRPWFDKDVSDPSRRLEWAERLRPLVEASEELKGKVKLFGQPWETHERFVSESINSLMRHNHAFNIERWRMYCLTPDPASVLMWSYYSAKHTGICLEFDATGNFFGGAQKVTYCEDLPMITPELFGDQIALTETILLTKSDDWVHEKEYRLLPRDRKHDPDFSLVCDGEFLPLPPGALTAVICGAKCSDTDFEAIQALLGKAAPHAMLKRAVRAPHKYAISITP